MLVKARVESLRPLRRPARPHAVGQVDLETLATCGFVAVVVAYFVLADLAAQTDVLVRARDAICGGDQDFVYQRQSGNVSIGLCVAVYLKRTALAIQRCKNHQKQSRSR